MLSESDVLNSKNQPGKAYHATGSVYGGSFWSKLGDFARNIGRPLLNVARTVAPMFNPALAAPLELASSVASAVGVGRRRSGGKAISRKQLALMMRDGGRAQPNIHV